MPDPASPSQPAGPAEEPAVGALTPERIERALADFRDWLTDLPAAPVAPEPPEPIDLHTLVAQFTALRQEVNLQTRATRSALEQNAVTLEQLAEAVGTAQSAATLVDEPPPAPDFKPLLKGLTDAYDALALAQRQVEKQRASFNDGLFKLSEVFVLEIPPVVPPEEVRVGFWGKLFGQEPPPSDPQPLLDWHRRTAKAMQEREALARQTSDFLRDALDGLLTGYAMSLNRLDRILTQAGLQVMKCAGERFDPEMMEVVEAVPNSGRQMGEVLEEVRRGYTWNGAVFRYAQVRVAR